MKRFLLLFLLVAVVGCKSNPYSGRNQTLLYSDEKMIAMGEAAYAEMTGPNSKVKISTDGNLNGPLRRVGQAISTSADQPDYKWEFKLIDDPKMANAWALPGGKIAFYTGIYPVLEDEAGMAIVMGHEVMHALMNHSNERMSQQTLTAIGMTAASVALHDNENRGLILAGLGAGATLGYILPYSRSHESEADKYGLFLAAKAGYDPEAGIKVWERMAALSEGKRPPLLLSTHPDPLQRVENMKAWMPEAKQHYENSRKRANNRLPTPPGIKKKKE